MALYSDDKVAGFGNIYRNGAQVRKVSGYFILEVNNGEGLMQGKFTTVSRALTELFKFALENEMKTLDELKEITVAPVEVVEFGGEILVLA